ncbi:PAS/PAC sensor-containing diguanylate cyclase/phosphodiesterase [Salinisphaera sp. PC39]|uniref:diguanylate cyclase domain-containing protein n=1 Tax=Salinisphaera sp. PC39 TaxID=1304156 RepID=UPI003342905D
MVARRSGDGAGGADGQRLRREVTPARAQESRALLREAAPIALWVAALAVALLLPFLLYGSFSAGLDRLDRRVVAAAGSELAPRIRQDRIPRELVTGARGLLERPDLGLNYLTLRNADGVILLSDGRFEGVGDALPAAQARQLRGWLYRLASDDRRIALRHDGEALGYMSYGIDLRRAAAGLPLWFWPALLIWLAALPVAVLSFAPARGTLSRLLTEWRGTRPASIDEPSEPQAAVYERAAPATTSTPAAARATGTGEDDWQRIADALGLGVIVCDSLGRVRTINGVAGSLLDRPADLLRGRLVDELADFTDDEGRVRASPLQRCLSGENGPVRDTLRIGEHRRLGMAAARLERSRIQALLWPAEPAPAAAPAADNAFAGGALWELSDEPAAITDVDGVIRAANPAWCERLVPGGDVPAGMPLARFVPEAGNLFPLSEPVVTGESAGADGGEPVTYRIAAIESGGMPTYLVTLRPGAAPSLAADDATGTGRDPLTGLPARDRLATALKRLWPADELAAALGLLVLDIVDFGRRNRSLGRDACDELLAAFARRLTAAVPAAEIVARLGGDEFAVLVRLTADAEDIDVTARRIADAFGEPVRSGDHELMMPVDVGYAVAPEDADSPAALLACAETALTAAQVAGEHSPRRYAPDMADFGVDVDRTTQALRRDLARRAVTLRLRPVWAGTGADAPVAAAWAEPVWDAPGDRQYAGPALFEHAESLDMAGEVAAWCLRALAETYADWRNIGLTPVPLAIPLSTGAAVSERLPEAWRAAQSRNRVPPEALVLVLPSDAAVPTDGPRRIYADDAADGQGLYLEVATLANDTATAAERVAAVRTRGLPVLAGPVTDAQARAAVDAAGVEYWFGDIDDAVAPRAFGRLIARRGAQPM